MVNYKWWSSPYTWYLIAITLVIVALSITTVNTESEWFNGLEKPPGYIPGWGFSIIWGILYPLILIGAIAAAWNGDIEKSQGITFVYTIILILSLCWIYAFFSYQELGMSAFVMVSLVFITGFLLFLLYKHNWWSFGFFSLFMIWILMATYYALAINYLN